jgi:hypothetical protein
MPASSTVFKWLGLFPSFAEQYARARESQAETLAEDILEIADDARNDWMERRGEEDAGWVANGEHIQRSRLRIDARKWLMSKMAPKKYGEKLDLNVGGSLQTMSEEAIDARIAQLLRKAGAGAAALGVGETQGEK